MPFVETVPELADAIADLLGVYGDHEEEAECPDDPRRMCRVCLVSVFEARIRTAVANEARLAVEGASL